MTPAELEARRLIGQYGARLADVSSGLLAFAMNAHSPGGTVFTATGTHMIQVSHLNDPVVGWRELLAELGKGVEPCDNPDCPCEEGGPA